MSQSGAAFCFLRVDEKVDVGSEMYLLDTDARGSEARQDLHQHLSLDGARQALVHTWVYLLSPSPFVASAATGSAAAQRQPLVPSARLWQENTSWCFIQQ